MIGVRYHRPLQQGLRPNLVNLYSLTLASTRPSSTTTRIKTLYHQCDKFSHHGVRYHRPLQQGLRLSMP